MKKIMTLILAAALCLTALVGCGDNVGTDSNNYDSKTYKVAVVQQLDHSSLNEIRDAIEAELDAAPEGVTVTYENFNGQNDSTVLNQIGSQIVSGGYDAIIPIGTLAAQCMANAADGNIPVIYAAISDPETAGLTGLDNVTGTSDALNTDSIMNMIFAANPNVQTVGLLYSNSEPNSTTPIANAKAYLDSKGIKYVEKTGNTADEVLSAANALAAAKVDAVFTPTDNTIMTAELAIYEKFLNAKIPQYCGADSFALNGAFVGYGVDYTKLGTITADMVVQVLVDGKDPATLPVTTFDNGIAMINTESCAAIGYDLTAVKQAFDGKCSSVLETTTQQNFN